MSRISRPHMFMQMCEAAALRSTCMRGNVAALVVKDNDILAMGYNGPGPGEDHCRGNKCELTPSGGCSRSVHAEANALTRAWKKDSEPWEQSPRIGRWDLYCTYSPCVHCASMILANPVNRVFYRYTYRDRAPLEMLRAFGIDVYRITTSGYIIGDNGNVIEEVWK